MTNDDNSNSNDNENSSSNIDEFIKRLDISLAEIEEMGTIFLVLGYSNFFVGADIDILEALDINTTGQSPDSVTLFGQQLVLTGYIFLWIVATKRVEEKQFRNENSDGNFILEPYIQISEAYLLSVFANYIRYVAFAQIAEHNNNSEFIE